MLDSVTSVAQLLCWFLCCPDMLVLLFAGTRKTQATTFYTVTPKHLIFLRPPYRTCFLSKLQCLEFSKICGPLILTRTLSMISAKWWWLGGADNQNRPYGDNDLSLPCSMALDPLQLTPLLFSFLPPTAMLWDASSFLPDALSLNKVPFLPDPQLDNELSLCTWEVRLWRKTVRKKGNRGLNGRGK